MTRSNTYQRAAPDAGRVARAPQPARVSANVARIVTIDAQDPRLKGIVSAFAVDEGELRVQSTDLFGLNIEHAIVLRSKKAA